MADEGSDVDANRRQIVLHPRTAAARRVDRSRAFGSHVRGFTVQTEDVFALVDAQRKASIRFLVTLVAPVLLLLVSFVLLPQVTNWSIAGVPAPWILLGPVTLFSIVAVAWLHDRNARRIEREWAAGHPEFDS